MLFILQQDKPLYQASFTPNQPSIKQIFLVHSSLDSIDTVVSKRRDYYLSNIKTQQVSIFAYVNPNLIRFVLVINLGKKEIDKKMDTMVKEFFIKINQAIAIVMINPLYRVGRKITSKAFDQHVRKTFNVIKDYHLKKQQ